MPLLTRSKAKQATQSPQCSVSPSSNSQQGSPRGLDADGNLRNSPSQSSVERDHESGEQQNSLDINYSPSDNDQNDQEHEDDAVAAFIGLPQPHARSTRREESPFEQARGDFTRHAWGHVSVDLVTASTRNGGPPMNRTGEACQARFKAILNKHKKDQTRSAQKTGTFEEVDAHIQSQVMDQLQALHEAKDIEKDRKSSAAKKKDNVKKQAALEIRDAAMKGVVSREALTDMADIDGLLYTRNRDKGKSIHSRDSSSSSDPEAKENDGLSSRSHQSDPVEAINWRTCFRTATLKITSC
ncbi:hypothetical protein C8J56DRAFT_888833 [Mycena floridula]|nr:hypothetical protein C8J56DRAFT_888833 [Mycena floridula]